MGLTGMPSKLVLLSGVSGFLGSRTAIDLLNLGYRVRGTVRNLDRGHSIRNLISPHTNRIDQLEFKEAHLLNPGIWAELMEGVDYVQHIASPFPLTTPKDENDLIEPAKNGTLSILKAAANAGVKRVVVTSSTSAIIYGKNSKSKNASFTENDWTDLSIKKDTTPYFRSKTIAEKAAWDFIKNDNQTELAVVCPGAILGPVLDKNVGTSANIVLKIMDGSSPAIPKIGFDMVDVRSVSDLLIRAMIKPEAANQRFVGSAGYLSFVEVAEILRGMYPEKKVPRYSLPNFAVKLYARLEPSLKPILLDLGTKRTLDHSKAENMLGWKPIEPAEAVRSCARSLVGLKLV